MTRFNEWITELERATQERTLKSNPSISQMGLYVVSKITVFDIRKYKFVQVGPNGRFAVAMDGTIYAMRNNDVNKKVSYGNVDTFEEFDWSTYYPTRKSLYAWQSEKQLKPKRRKATRSRSMVKDISMSGWPFTKGTSEANGIHGTEHPNVGEQGTTPTLAQPETPNSKGDRTSNQSRKKRSR